MEYDGNHYFFNIKNSVFTLGRSDVSSSLRKRLRIRSVISVNYHYITILCPFNLLIRFKCYKLYKTNLNKYKSVYFTCFVNKIEIQGPGGGVTPYIVYGTDVPLE